MAVEFQHYWKEKEAGGTVASKAESVKDRGIQDPDMLDGEPGVAIDVNVKEESVLLVPKSRIHRKIREIALWQMDGFVWEVKSDVLASHDLAALPAVNEWKWMTRCSRKRKKDQTVSGDGEGIAASGEGATSQRRESLDEVDVSPLEARPVPKGNVDPTMQSAKPLRPKQPSVTSQISKFCHSIPDVTHLSQASTISAQSNSDTPSLCKPMAPLLAGAKSSPGALHISVEKHVVPSRARSPSLQGATGTATSDSIAKFMTAPISDSAGLEVESDHSNFATSATACVRSNPNVKTSSATAKSDLLENQTKANRQLVLVRNRETALGKPKAILSPQNKKAVSPALFLSKKAQKATAKASHKPSQPVSKPPKRAVLKDAREGRKSKSPLKSPIFGFFSSAAVNVPQVTSSPPSCEMLVRECLADIVDQCERLGGQGSLVGAGLPLSSSGLDDDECIVID